MGMDTMIDEQSLPKVIFVGLTFFFYMVTFERTIANVFVLNFGAGAINASILLFLATMTGLFYTFAFNYVWPHSRIQLSSSVSVGFLMLICSAIPIPIIALLAVVIYQVAITPVIVHYLQVLKKGFTASAILGVALMIASRSLLDTASYYATNFGLFVLSIIASLWLILWLWMSNRFDHEEFPSDLYLTSTSSLFSYMIIQLLFLGSPSVMSTWFLRDYFFVAIAAILGLIIGWYIISEDYLGKFDREVVDWGIAIVYLLAMVSVIWIPIEFLAIIFIFFAQLTAVLLLNKGIRVGVNSSILHLGRKKAGIQLVIILATFFVIGAPFWTAMPLSFLLERNDKLLMFVVSALLPISAMRTFFYKEGKI